MFLTIHHRVAKSLETHEQLSLFCVSIFSLIQILKSKLRSEPFRYNLKYFFVNTHEMVELVRDRTADLLRAKAGALPAEL